MTFELFSARRPEVFPALELAGSLGRVSEEQVSNRLRLIAQFAEKKWTDGGILVASIQSLMQSVPSPRQLEQLILPLRPGQNFEAEKLIVWLSEHGYNRLDQVEVPGDFAVRGGIIDIYLPGIFQQAGEQLGLTVRIDFFDDQIESIRRFDLDSLGSGDALESVGIIDIKGQLPDTGESTSLFNYLPPGGIVAFWAPLEIAEQSKSYLDRLPEVKGIYPLNALLKLAAQFTRVELSQFDQQASMVGEDVPHFRLPVGSLQRFETEAKKAIKELAELAQTHDVTVFCENTAEKQRFTELIDGEIPGLSAKIDTSVGYLHRGFVWDFGEGQKPHGPAGAPRAVSSLRAAAPRRQGDRVPAGRFIPRFEGRRLRRSRRTRHRPVHRHAHDEQGRQERGISHPAIRRQRRPARPGRADQPGAEIHRRVSRPSAAVAPRQRGLGKAKGQGLRSRHGHGGGIARNPGGPRGPGRGSPIRPIPNGKRNSRRSFPTSRPQDQITGAEEIKQDMQKPRPMDRLLCGDVGYGKTELAMRAPSRPWNSANRWRSWCRRPSWPSSTSGRSANGMAELSVSHRIHQPIQERQGAEGDRRAARPPGEIDILIGTHRLLSKDVKFADLGLVVIDEEQRFGVTHKERLKQMRRTVDVLTMSATPIPRTLHMSMLGLRDISSLTTAPQDRRSIVTEVIAYDKQRIQQAILRELNREGQVYFVHNRVYNIAEVADEIQKLVPDARIIIGHGQMAEGELEEVMLKFIRHEADILVCTTIIESGLDIPNANTIFINQADRFGLSELHQLRGRVGRYKNRAYCYLLLPADRPVTPVAAKRLKAIEEYSHLGAGFKIAMRDLEIRGAGNILGPEQSGHIATVGYEMYCQLLEEATRQLKNEPKPAKPEAHVDIGVSAPGSQAMDRRRPPAHGRLSATDPMHLAGNAESVGAGLEGRLRRAAAAGGAAPGIDGIAIAGRDFRHREHHQKGAGRGADGSRRIRRTSGFGRIAWEIDRAGRKNGLPAITRQFFGIGHAADDPAEPAQGGLPAPASCPAGHRLPKSCRKSLLTVFPAPADNPRKQKGALCGYRYWAPSALSRRL